MSDLPPVSTSSAQPAPVDSLIAAFMKLGLVSEEIADTIWLALEIQQYESPYAPGENAVSQPDKLPPKPALPKSIDSATNSNTDTATSLSDSPKQAEIITGSEQTSGDRNLAIRLPDARSLPEPLALARALRPLFLRVPSANLVLDEAATIDRIAEEQLWTAVLTPDLEPWLELALVVDESPSMLLWQRTIRELQDLLEGYGIFRDVRTWGMTIEPVVDRNGITERQVRLRPGIGKVARDRRTRSPGELLDPQGRRLIMIATDCVASHWHDGTMLSTLKTWSQSGSTAIIQMLPEWLWSRTALGRAAPVRFRALLPGLSSNCLQAKPLSSWDEIDFKKGIKVPLVTLEPEIFTTWSQLVAGKGGVWAPGFVFEPEFFDDEEDSTDDDLSAEQGVEEDSTDVDLSAEQQVSEFYHSASPMAWRLISLLAAAPVICLPVVRIIQRELLPKSRQVHVAEVFLGGLIGPCQPLSEINQDTDPDTILYGIEEDVRTVLLESSPQSDFVNLSEVFSEFFGSQIGRSVKEFVAYLRDPDRVKNGEIQSSSIATITAKFLKQLGGEYTRHAEQLEGGEESSTVEGAKIPSEAIEQERPSIDYKRSLGGTLRVDDFTYVTRQADRDFYEGLKAGEFCYVLNSCQMGKSSLRVRTMARLKSEGIACAAIDMTEIIDKSITEERWYAGIIDELVNGFELSNGFDLGTWWRERPLLSCVQRFSEFIETVVLVQPDRYFVVFIDEIDSILNLGFSTDDFFAYIRSCWNERADKPEYRRLTFAILGVAEPSDLIQDRQRTPFNIGRAIELNGFSFEEAQPLIDGLRSKAENPQIVLQEILKWTGGQPFLTQKVCYAIAQLDLPISNRYEEEIVRDVIRTQVIDNWETHDRPEHLATIRNRILAGNEKQIGELLRIYEQILINGKVDLDNSREQMELRLTGLVVKSDNKLKVYNRIYTEVFNREWIDRALANSIKNRALANSIKKILILAANPRDSVRLSLDREVSEIRNTLQLSANRDRFAIEVRGAVRPDDLQQYMHDVKPQIVHFSSHGEGSVIDNVRPEGLVFEDEDDRAILVSGTVLSKLFELFGDRVECVVLNSCYSIAQAQEIFKHIPYVVGIKRAIGDIAARKFSQGFYRAIWDDRSIEEAFDSGRNAMDIGNIPESLTPVLLKRSTSDSLAERLRQRVPPIPANLEEPEGLVPLNSRFYIERPLIEERCYEEVAGRGALIRIKAPRLMGKSSLMLRVSDRAKHLGYRTVKLELGFADNLLLHDLDKFLRWFCISIGQELGLPNKIDECWKNNLSSKKNCTNYFRDYLLKPIKTPIVLILDRVDEIFKDPIAIDFFGLLRAWHEMSKSEQIWENLRLIVIYSQEHDNRWDINQSPFQNVGVEIELSEFNLSQVWDINQSPFQNVGVEIELSEFNLSQVKDLHTRHGLRWSNTEIEELMIMVGGHPFLIRVAFYHTARQYISFRQLLNDAPTEAGVYSRHLRRCFDSLKNNDLLAAMQQVVATDNPVHLPVKEAYQLYGMGLIMFLGNEVIPRCNLYRLYFRDRLGVNG